VSAPRLHPSTLTGFGSWVSRILIRSHHSAHRRRPCVGCTPMPVRQNVWMPLLSDLFVWPPTGHRSSAWVRPADNDAFVKTARRVCELHSEVIASLGIEGRLVGGLRPSHPRGRVRLLSSQARHSAPQRPQPVKGNHQTTGRDDRCRETRKGRQGRRPCSGRDRHTQTSSGTAAEPLMAVDPDILTTQCNSTKSSGQSEHPPSCP
jgi:hypothetical protein